MKFEKNLSVLVIILCCLSKMTSQSVSVAELIRVPFTSHHDKEKKEYFMYLPYGYRSSPDRKWPVLMFLHGNGERGNGREDLDWVIKEGPLYEAWIQKRDLPFIIIAPQLPMYGMDSISYIRDRNPSQIPKRLEAGVPQRPAEFETTQKMSPQAAAAWFPDPLPPAGWEREEDDLMDMVENVIKEYRGDEDRIYLTGLSYGGFGTWYMASKHPKTWAAICPVVGWGHPDLMKPIAEHQIPLWVFAGGRDRSVDLTYFYAGLNKLEELGHKDVRFTIEEDMGHDVWRRVYGGEDVYAWLLSKKKN
ncbi:MAG: prolyl oligopeptidase family serine peptidase [Saprospiraceae bacterium]